MLLELASRLLVGLLDILGVVGGHDECRVVGLDDDASMDDPWLRYATEDEVRELGLDVPAGSRAYRIVATHHADGPPSQDIFVVADGVEAEIRRAADDGQHSH